MVLQAQHCQMSRTQPALQDPDQARSPQRSCPAPSTAVRVGAGAAEGNGRPAQPSLQGFLFIHLTFILYMV